jgi:membrane protease YdiL (CAAX protease family)
VVQTSARKRAALFLLFFLCALAVFTLAMTFSPHMSQRTEGTVRVTTTVVFLVAAVTAYQFPSWKPCWLVFFACFAASFSLLMAWRLSDYGLNIFSLTTRTPAGIAVAKLSEAIIVVFFIVVLAVAARSDLASIYLQRGNLKRGLTIGLVAFAALSVVGVVQALGHRVGVGRLFSWVPWILIFVLATGFMEELLFRGIFLKRLEPVIGAWPANGLTALVFALAHAKVTYAPNVLVFMGITFVLGLVWGYIMQKTDSLIGSWLFHAGADVLIIIGIFVSL